MKSALKEVLLQVVADSGLPGLLQRTLWRHSLTIVTYHGLLRAPLPVPDWCFLDEGVFAAQVRYLGERFSVLPLLEAQEMLQEGRRPKDGRPAAAITFDDGFQSVHDLALPVLRSLGLPATVFLNSGLCGTADTVWFCRLHGALCRTGRREVRFRGDRYDLRGPRRRSEASGDLQTRLKLLPHDEMLAELARLVTELGDDPAAPIGEASPFRMLSREAARALAASGLFTLGAHTHNHTILSRIPGPRCQEEIERSLSAVAELAGGPCRSFAYPNGRREDYGPEALAALREKGVRVAVTSIPGPNVKGTPALELSRYGIGGDATIASFRCLVHHMMGGS